MSCRQKGFCRHVNPIHAEPLSLSLPSLTDRCITHSQPTLPPSESAADNSSRVNHCISPHINRTARRVVGSLELNEKIIRIFLIDNTVLTLCYRPTPWITFLCEFNQTFYDKWQKVTRNSADAKRCKTRKICKLLIN